MDQSIFRIQKDSNNPYVMVNKELLNNTELSWKAKGLLTYLLSLPDNWKIYEDEIVKHAKDGKDSLKSAIKELITHGYIERERIRNSSGQLKGYSYCVYEIPSQSGKSNDGNSIKGKSATTNNNYTDIDINNNENNYMGSRSIDTCPSLTFEKYKSQYLIESDAIGGIEYYLEKYKNHTGKVYGRHKKEKWDYIVSDWFKISNSERPTRDFKADAENMESVINSHFNTTYEKGDYSIIHFLSGNIKAHRYYENFGAF